MCSTGAEEVPVHEEKDGDWGGGILPLNPGMGRPAMSKEGHSDTPPATFNRRSTAITGEALEEGRDETAPCSLELETTETAETGPQEENRETLAPEPDKNRHLGAHNRKDEDSEESRVEKSTEQVGRDQPKEPQRLEEREEPCQMKELVRLTPWATGCEEEQSRGKGGGSSKGAFQKLGS